MFRLVLGDPENAASQLSAVLPPGLVARMDLDRLALAPGSFVDTSLRWRHTDLLFTAPLDGRDALVYVLVEHQSSDDPLMAFRMLRYVVRIWDRYLDQNKHTKLARLPAVIPLVVYHQHDGCRWSSPTELTDLIDLDSTTVETMGEYLPRFRFLLDDLASIDEQALRARPVTPLVRLTLVLLKIATGSTQLAKELREWADDLLAVRRGPGGFDYFVALVTYIQRVGETPADELLDLFASLGPDVKEAYMTTAEQLRAEGEAKGRTQGRVDALVQQLTLKFGPLDAAVLDTVYTATSDQLEAWTARVLTADTLDEVLHSSLGVSG